jgi:hypothetical protein
VHNADGSKLNPRAREAHWLRFDVDVKVHRVYWPGPGNVGVERNIYFTTSAQLEGEEEDLPAKGNEQTDAPPSPSTSQAPDTPSTPAQASADTGQPEKHRESLTPLHRSTRTRKPSRIIHELQAGEGTTSTRGTTPQTTPDPPIPDLVTNEEEEEEEEEAGGAWIVVHGSP